MEGGKEREKEGEIDWDREREETGREKERQKLLQKNRQREKDGSEGCYLLAFVRRGRLGVVRACLLKQQRTPVTEQASRFVTTTVFLCIFDSPGIHSVV